MTDLIKAQWYSLTHEGKSHLIYLSCFIVLLFAAFVDCIDGITFSGYIIHSRASIMCSACGAGFLVTLCFASKLTNYEIMAGYSAHSIVSAKLILGALISLATYLIPVYLILAVNDLSALTAQNISVLFLCWLKLYMFVTCICIIFKSPAGLVAALMMFVFETLPVFILQLITGKDLSFMATWFSATQLGMLGAEDIDKEMFVYIPDSKEGLLLKTVISTVVVCSVMYYLAYRSIKNKWLAEQPSLNI